MWVLVGSGVLCLLVGIVFGWVCAAMEDDGVPVHRPAYKYYGREGRGHVYGPGEMHKFNPGGSMKTCHACGQKLPLKAGDVVETKYEGKAVRGVVVHAPRDQSRWTDLTLFDGRKIFASSVGMTRLHGHYRITERETL